MNKKEALRAAFLRGEVLTPLVALNKYRCLSLSQRVGDFKKEGLAIKDKFVNGQPYKAYWIERQMPLELLVDIAPEFFPPVIARRYA